MPHAPVFHILGFYPDCFERLERFPREMHGNGLVTVAMKETHGRVPLVSGNPVYIHSPAYRLNCREKVGIAHHQVERPHPAHRKSCAIDAPRINDSRIHKRVEQFLDGFQRNCHVLVFWKSARGTLLSCRRADNVDPIPFRRALRGHYNDILKFLGTKKEVSAVVKLRHIVATSLPRAMKIEKKRMTGE